MTTTMTRTRTCVTCGSAFSYPIGKGNDRKHCSRACRARHKKALHLARLETMPKCSTAGCATTATASAGPCSPSSPVQVVDDDVRPLKRNAAPYHLAHQPAPALMVADPDEEC